MVSLPDDVQWPVSTARLCLRPAGLQDLEATWNIRRVESVSRWLTRAPQSRDEYRTHFEDPEALAKTLVIELDGQVIGDLMVEVRDAWAQVEVVDQARDVEAGLGWVLHPDHTGREFATEAMQEILRICFETSTCDGDRGLLRGERAVVAVDGATRDAPGGAHRAGVSAPVRCVAGRVGRCPPARRVARQPLISPSTRVSPAGS